MQHDVSGPVPPKPVPAPVPHAYARRKGKNVPLELAIISRAVMTQGAAINAKALAEETGMKEGGIWIFAAMLVIHGDMVEDDVIEFEDSIRIGSRAEIAMLEKQGLRYDSIEPSKPMRNAPDALAALRRRVLQRRQSKRLVAAPRTTCPNCGARANADGGCAHQQMLVPADTIEKGRPHA